MITSPHSNAIGSAAYGCTPNAVVSANHMDTTAMPEVIKMAQPMLWNLIRSPGQRARMSGLAPDNVIKNWPGFDICRSAVPPLPLSRRRKHMANVVIVRKMLYSDSEFMHWAGSC